MKILEYNVKTNEITQREMTAEELAQMQEIENLPQPEIPYSEKVVSLIRQRYSLDDELAIHRQREVKPNEWQVYFDYCEWCKNESK